MCAFVNKQKKVGTTMFKYLLLINNIFQQMCVCKNENFQIFLKDREQKKQKFKNYQLGRLL